MPAVFTETQIELAKVAADITADGLVHQRSAVNGIEFGNDTTTALLEGFGSLGISEECGGDGGSLVDLVVFVESLSRTIEPTQIFYHYAALQIAQSSGIDIKTAIEQGEKWTISFSGDLKAYVPFAKSSDKIIVVSPDESSVRLVSGGIGKTSISKVDVQRGKLVLAAHLVGVARGSLNSAVSYAGQRQQFGQFIGTFQGVAHPLSDAFVELEAAWSLVLYAAWALDQKTSDSLMASHLAVAKSGAMAIDVCERALQVFGGIGVTWEADAHLYIRRVLAVTALIGGHSTQFRQAGICAVNI
jgi:alkylation response protein AidB-like acyl-CoA dehydrogenase